MNCIDHKCTYTYTPTLNDAKNSLNIHDLSHIGHENRKVEEMWSVATLVLTLVMD
jgi:hypothetical protein